ncbi:MAG: response regulator, partial [Myxococcales bacterium]|nr:response regulator [Myxococcales bacterium]
MGAPTTLNVLVVDDDRPTQLMLWRLLGQNGFTAETASNGVEAVARLSEKRFQIVLTDWSMPEMDGEALCRWIRQREGDEYTYVMILTGNDDKAHLRLGFEAG